MILVKRIVIENDIFLFDLFGKKNIKICIVFKIKIVESCYI